MMQFIGIDTLYNGLSEKFPQIGKQFCIRRLSKWMEENPGKLVVISDLRMEENVPELKKLGALIIKLKRPNSDTKDTHIVI